MTRRYGGRWGTVIFPSEIPGGRPAGTAPGPVTVRQLTEEELAELEERVAAKLRAEAARVHRGAEEEGTMARQPVTWQRIVTALTADPDMSVSALAKVLGVSPATVYTLCTRHGGMNKVREAAREQAARVKAASGNAAAPAAQAEEGGDTGGLDAAPAPLREDTATSGPGGTVVSLPPPAPEAPEPADPGEAPAEVPPPPTGPQPCRRQHHTIEGVWRVGDLCRVVEALMLMLGRDAEVEVLVRAHQEALP